MTNAEKREYRWLWWNETHWDAYADPEQGIIENLYLEQLIAKLPGSFQRLLRFYYWDGYTHQEMAKTGLQQSRRANGVGVTTSAISKRHRKALSMLGRMTEL